MHVNKIGILEHQPILQSDQQIEALKSEMGSMTQFLNSIAESISIQRPSNRYGDQGQGGGITVSVRTRVIQSVSTFSFCTLRSDVRVFFLCDIINLDDDEEISRHTKPLPAIVAAEV